MVAGAGLSAEAKTLASAGLVKLLDEAGVVEARDSLAKLTSSWLSELSDSFVDLATDSPVEAKFLSGLVFATGMA